MFKSIFKVFHRFNTERPQATEARLGSWAWEDGRVDSPLTLRRRLGMVLVTVTGSDILHPKSNRTDMVQGFTKCFTV